MNCKDNSDEDVSNDTVCGMCISFYFKGCLLFSLFLPHTAAIYPQVHSTNIASTAMQQ